MIPGMHPGQHGHRTHDCLASAWAGSPHDCQDLFRETVLAETICWENVDEISAPLKLVLDRNGDSSNKYVDWLKPKSKGQHVLFTTDQSFNQFGPD